MRNVLIFRGFDIIFYTKKAISAQGIAFNYSSDVVGSGIGQE